jgi:hypothetical protein
LDQETNTLSNNMFKRQVSAPVRLSQGMFTRQLLAPEPELEPDEDELDEDPFNSLAAPTRQMSVMSGGPSRQVSATQEWDPIRASNIQRQSTDELWPSYQSNDALQPSSSGNLSNIEQLGFGLHGSEQSSEPALSTWMFPQQCTDSGDVHAVPTMFQGCGAMYAWQLVPPHQQNNADQLAFRQKRESLIDLAKKQQELRIESQGEGEAPKASSIKFCPFCGGKFMPSFRFCVFCGQSCSDIQFTSM